MITTPKNKIHWTRLILRKPQLLNVLFCIYNLRWFFNFLRFRYAFPTNRLALKSLLNELDKEKTFCICPGQSIDQISKAKLKKISAGNRIIISYAAFSPISKGTIFYEIDLEKQHLDNFWKIYTKSKFYDKSKTSKIVFQISTKDFCRSKLAYARIPEAERNRTFFTYTAEFPDGDLDLFDFFYKKTIRYRNLYSKLGLIFLFRSSASIPLLMSIYMAHKHFILIGYDGGGPYSKFVTRHELLNQEGITSSKLHKVNQSEGATLFQIISLLRKKLIIELGTKQSIYSKILKPYNWTKKL